MKRLVYTSCANYQKEYDECTLLDGQCYMMGKHYTGAFCRYFQNAVLPLHPELEMSLCGKHGKSCVVCDGLFLPKSNRQKYCSPKCTDEGRRCVDRIRDRKRRDTTLDLRE